MAKKASSTAGRSTKKVAKKATKKKAVAKKAAAKPKASKKSPRAKARPSNGESLRKTDVKKFREMLLEKRRSILGDMSGIQAETSGQSRSGGSSDLSNMPTHPADLGTDNYEHEFSLGLLESERALLAEIDEALERINEGTFGQCLGTGKPIGKARLEARPWAKYCIEYARMVEKGLVRAGDRIELEDEEDDELDDED